jgi:arylsulfatase A
MDRRNFMKTSAGAACGLGLTGAGEAFAGTKKPNIIIIMADDLGYGDLSCYGSEAVSTPNLDRMADEGVKMTSFFSSAPVCSPSRAGLLTGRYPTRMGIYGVYFPSKNPTTPLIHMVYGMKPGMNTNEITLAEAIKPAGYSTCCIGKWHLGDMKKYRPNHRGFDHFMGVHYSNDMTPLKLYRNDEVIEKHPVDQRYLTQKYTEEAIGWIKENKDDPFLLYLPHTFPHRPLFTSPEFEDKSKGGLYGDIVETIDWSTGEILDTLDELGIAENTFVFFTSDNGPWFQGSAGGFRGRKGESFRGGMQVPGIARWPGTIPAGQTTDEMSMNIDLFATSLALAGLDVPDDRIIDGKDIMPVLTQGAKSPHEALYLHNGKKLQAIRAGRWEYRLKHAGWGAALYGFLPLGPMLFDLDNDRDESYDVSDLYPEKVKEMEQMAKDWKKNFKKGI